MRQIISWHQPYECCRWAAYANGFDVEVATDNIWSQKTTAQFATYRAIIFGDNNMYGTNGAGTISGWTFRGDAEDNYVGFRVESITSKPVFRWDQMEPDIYSNHPHD